LTAIHNLATSKEGLWSRQAHTLEGATCGEGERAVVEEYWRLERVLLTEMAVVFGGSLQRA